MRLCTPQLQLTLVSLMSVASPMANTLDWPATCSLSFTCTAHEGTLPAAHSMYMCQGHRLLTVQSFKVKASGHQLHGARKPGMISSASHFQSLCCAFSCDVRRLFRFMHLDGAPGVQDAQRLQERSIRLPAESIVHHTRVQAAAVGQVPAAVGALRRLLPVDNLRSGSPPL
jgi:hypothetical protein